MKQENAHTISWLGQPETRFTFDHVAGEFVTQEELFRVAGLPMVDNCMAGYNSCMFAYGQVRLLSHPDHIYAELMKAKTSKNIRELQNRFLNSCVLLGRFQGFHCFDFVQTGSGKTHTMLGDMGIL